MNASSMLTDQNNTIRMGAHALSNMHNSADYNNIMLGHDDVDDGMDDDTSLIGTFYGSTTNTQDQNSLKCFEIEGGSFELSLSLLTRDRLGFPIVDNTKTTLLLSPYAADAINLYDTVICDELKENNESIIADIEFVRQKACILERASHILFQQNRDYHKIALYHSWLEEQKHLLESSSTNDRMSIWDEAKLFLFEDNDENIPSENYIPVPLASKTENTRDARKTQPGILSINATMKSISAVQQYCDSNRLNPNLSSIQAPPVKNVRKHFSRKRIDTSTVQRVTSTQHEETVAFEKNIKNCNNSALSTKAQNELREKEKYEKLVTCDLYHQLSTLESTFDNAENQISRKRKHYSQ